MLTKKLILLSLSGVVAFTATLLLSQTDPPNRTSPENTTALTTDHEQVYGKGDVRSSAANMPPAVRQLASHVDLNNSIALQRIDYAKWQASLQPPQGALSEVLSRLNASPTPLNNYLAANLLRECELRVQGSLAIREGYEERDSRLDECEALGDIASAAWIERMKAAADAGFAPAQVAMASIEDPHPSRVDEGKPSPWLDMQIDYIEKAMSQCDANAFIIHGNFRFDADNTGIQNQAAYADFLTAELIYRHKFEGAPSISGLLVQEREKLHNHQVLEAEAQALANFHKVCTQ